MKVKLLLISLLILMGTIAQSAQDQAPYPVPYWIIGNLQQGACPIAPENFQIIVYKDPALPANGGDGSYRYLTNGAYADGYSGAAVNNSSPFKINAYDDLKMQKFTGAFYVGVVARTDANGNTWGVNETRFEIGADNVGMGGYSLSPPLELKLGEGVPSPIPAGTVPLTITHDGNDIVISWDVSQTANQNPNIYLLNGDGSGAYTNLPDNWIWVNDPAAPAPGFDNPRTDGLTDGILRYLGQYGNNSTVPEAYLKALQTPHIKTDINPDTSRTYFQDAWAVGKMDKQLIRNDFELINVPFSITANNVSQIIGSQLTNATLVYNEDGLKQILLIGGTWDYEIPLTLATGYWLRSDDKDATITYLGDVIHSIYFKTLDLGFDLYGYPVPRKTDAAALGIAPVTGDLMLLNRGGLTQFSYTDKWDSPFTISPLEGFWYQNQQTAPARKLEVTP